MTSVNPALRRWLAERIVRIESIRQCLMNREGDPPVDIQAMTWSSLLINIYLFDHLEKARAIKRLVSENTRVGVGTLCLIDADIVPADGDRLTPDDMLTACHALFKDKLYTYRMEGATPKIGQVHFKAFGRGDEREVWYGPDLDIRNLPCYRVTVPAPSTIKGDWLIAGFGTSAFWKTADYTAGRDAFRQQQRTGYTRRATWGASGWPGENYAEYDRANAEAERERMGVPVETRLDACYRQLGVGRGASYDEVKAAFRKLARELHPDVSTLPKPEAEARFRTINEAYSYIRSAQGWA